MWWHMNHRAPGRHTKDSTPAATNLLFLACRRLRRQLLLKLPFSPFPLLPNALYFFLPFQESLTDILIASCKQDNKPATLGQILWTTLSLSVKSAGWLYTARVLIWQRKKNGVGDQGSEIAEPIKISSPLRVSSEVNVRIVATIPLIRAGWDQTRFYRRLATIVRILLFYCAMYIQRGCSTNANWRWLQRTFFRFRIESVWSSTNFVLIRIVSLSSWDQKCHISISKPFSPWAGGT